MAFTLPFTMPQPSNGTATRSSASLPSTDCILVINGNKIVCIILAILDSKTLDGKTHGSIGMQDQVKIDSSLASSSQGSGAQVTAQQLKPSTNARPTTLILG